MLAQRLHDTGALDDAYLGCLGNQLRFVVDDAEQLWSTRNLFGTETILEMKSERGTGRWLWHWTRAMLDRRLYMNRS
jgi:hypothetical protein